MKEYIISYIEDNEIGGHKKEILVVTKTFNHAMKSIFKNIQPW
ncbi:hypothetical protein ACSU6B_15250 [Neobacillus sp. C211]